MTEHLKKEIDLTLLPMGREIAKGYSDLDGLIRRNLVERLKKYNKAQKASSKFYELWADFNTSFPLINGNDVVYLLLDEKADLSRCTESNKINKELYLAITNCWNDYVSSADVVDPVDYQEINDLINRSTSLLVEQERKLSHLHALLLAMRTENMRSVEMKEARRSKLIAEKDLAENQLKAFARRDDAIEDLLSSMEEVRKTLLEMKRNPDADTAGARSIISKLSDNINITLFSFGNIDASVNGVNTDVTLYKNQL